jgi:hypothetical protein
MKIRLEIGDHTHIRRIPLCVTTGKIGNWKEVVGKDLAIIIVWGKLIPGIARLLLKT